MPMPVEGAIQSYRMYIGGEWLDGQSGETFDSINPAMSEVWARFPFAGAADVDRAVREARQALEGPWRRMVASERSRIIRQIAEAIGADRRAPPALY